MKKTIVFILVMISFVSCSKAQDVDFEEFLSHYIRKIPLPIEDTYELAGKDTISSKLLNKFLFEKQKERAKFYSIDDTLYRLTTYSKVPERPFEYEIWKKENGKVVWYDTSFITRVYPIGQLHLSNNFHLLINKIVGYEYTYYDLYVFDKKGKLLSLVNLYEEEYHQPGNPGKGSNIYLTSSITKDGIIKWHQQRFGITTDREYKLREDGIFEIISQKQEGEFEY